MGTEGVILLVVALGGLGAFLVGVMLLVMYFRANRSDEWYDDEPVIYGSLVQCPACGYMNPLETPVCLNCRQPLPRPREYPAQPPAPRAVPPQRNYGPSMQSAVTGDFPQPQVPPQPPQSTLPVGPPPQIAQREQPPAQPTAQAAPPPDIPAPAPGEGRVWLEGIDGAIIGQHITIEQDDTLVGRSSSCNVQVYDPKVSRRHFLIRFANGGYFLQDQNSSRGTRINGKRVMAQRLQDGDRIEIGDSAMTFHTR